MVAAHQEDLEVDELLQAARDLALDAVWLKYVHFNEVRLPMLSGIGLCKFDEVLSLEN